MKLRFSLRTMLVLITALCVWLGWNAEVVRRRNATRAALQNLAVEIDDEKGMYIYQNGGLTLGHDFTHFIPHDEAHPRVSLIRRWFGDRAIWGISFPPNCPDELIKRFDKDSPENSPAYRVYTPDDTTPDR